MLKIQEGERLLTEVVGENEVKFDGDMPDGAEMFFLWEREGDVYRLTPRQNYLAIKSVVDDVDVVFVDGKMYVSVVNIHYMSDIIIEVVAGLLGEGWRFLGVVYGYDHVFKYFEISFEREMDD